MAQVIYFSGGQKLESFEYVSNAAFIAMGGVKSKHNRVDSFSRLAGRVAAGQPLLPVTRKVFYKSTPSLHKCDARCMNSKGHNCECSCGGKNHGVNA